MDATRKQIYEEVQAEVKRLLGVEIPIEQIDSVIQHQSFFFKENVEIIREFRFPLVGSFRLVTRRVERNYEAGKIVTVKNILHDMLSKQ